MLFIIQVAAVSCADTQVPETTLANQSLLKVGFCKAIQLEVLVIRIGASSAPKMHQDRLCRYRIRHRVNFSRTPEPSSISRKSRIAVDWQGVAIQGYDPVAYFTQNKPVKGSPSNQSVYQGAKFYFASAAKKPNSNGHYFGAGARLPKRPGHVSG